MWKMEQNSQELKFSKFLKPKRSAKFLKDSLKWGEFTQLKLEKIVKGKSKLEIFNFSLKVYFHCVDQ